MSKLSPMYSLSFLSRCFLVHPSASSYKFPSIISSSSPIEYRHSGLSFRKLQSISKPVSSFSERGFFFWKRLSQHLLWNLASAAGNSIIVAIRFDNVLFISSFKFSAWFFYVCVYEWNCFTHVNSICLHLYSYPFYFYFQHLVHHKWFLFKSNWGESWTERRKGFRCIRSCLFLGITFPARYMH